MSKLIFDFFEMKKRVKAFSEKITNDKLRRMFVKCFYNTLETTTENYPDGTVYVYTGDIDAMWLRDSSAQVMQYLLFADVDEDVCKLIKGLVARQCCFILDDPYANSFGKKIKGNFEEDECEKRPYVWERKFELDSLCYPLWLATKYYAKTGDREVFDGKFLAALDEILNVFGTEQRHKAQSSYYHYRPNEAPEFSVQCRGRGSDVAECGLVWSGYRPSDDPCKYGYFVPGNMFVSVVCKELLKISDKVPLSETQVHKLTQLCGEIDSAIAQFCIYDHPKYGKIYCYETDGLGHFNLMDDANVPSLLAIDYLGYDADKVVKENTRKFVLSSDNPYYYEGKCISGIGSPHTPQNYVWPISVIMQCLTTDDEKVINKNIEMLMNSDAQTDMMHEGIQKDNAEEFTRSWFAWANSLFSLMILQKSDKIKFVEDKK